MGKEDRKLRGSHSYTLDSVIDNRFTLHYVKDSPADTAVLSAHETGLNPTEIMTDTEEASDLAFGLFRLLGYPFSPRQADAGASVLVRSLLKSERPSGLAQAIIEVARINKTLYLLNFIDDEDYRQRILAQLNRGRKPS